MAVWTPGSYLIREYARHVEGLEVVAPAGGAAPVKTRKNRWAFDTGGAARVTVRYRVYGREMSVRTNWVESRFALLQGAATYLTLVGGLHRPHRVTLELPKGWAGAMSGLQGTDAGANTFEAADYDTLVDSPIVAGDLKVYEFSVSGKPHYLVNVNESGDVGRRASRQPTSSGSSPSTRSCGECLPYDKYVFLNVITEASGGLEHRNSDDADDLALGHGHARRPTSAWLSLVSHEFFHVWNAKRLRPSALGPFDYETENYTPSLWVVEGVTSYYGDLLVRRAGLWSDAEYFGDAVGRHPNPRDHAGTARAVGKQSSYDAWIKQYRPDENFANTSISYYTKGQVIAALLDARIRLSSNGQRSLDDVMRLAYSRYAGATRLHRGAVPRPGQEVGGAELADVLARALDTTQPLDYQPLLDAYGLQFAPADSLTTRGWLGISVKNDGGRLVVTQVRRDTPGAAGGVNVDDEILAIGDYRVRADQWDRRLEQFPPTTRATLLVARRDQLMQLEVTFGQEPGNAWRLAPRVAPTPAQLATRAAWLGGR